MIFVIVAADLIVDQKAVKIGHCVPDLNQFLTANIQNMAISQSVSQNLNPVGVKILNSLCVILYSLLYFTRYWLISISQKPRQLIFLIVLFKNVQVEVIWPFLKGMDNEAVPAVYITTNAPDFFVFFYTLHENTTGCTVQL